MKKRKIVFVIILIVGLFSLTSILYFNSKNKTLKNTDKKISEKNVINQAKKKTSENKNTTKDQSMEKEETSSKKQEESKQDSHNKKSSEQDSNNSANSNQVSSNTATSTTTDQKQTTSQQVQTPPRVQTEWERLGISEYDYYNTPSDNEGELAFKGSTSLCQNEIDRLTELYYDKGIDGGSHYTINGKYTHSYLGCGIYIIMKGKKYTYSQIKAMEKQGFFN